MRWMLVLFPLAACAAQTGTEMPQLGAADKCDVGQYQTLLGQPKEAITGVAFSGPVRVIEPDSAVTMDFSPERLNIDVDRTGLIVGLRCG